MRDAFGGAFMIKLFLVFIVLYVSFAAVSLNYAKAFRVKNKIIDYIEQNEIIDLYKLETGLDPILNRGQYNKTCIDGNGIINNKENQEIGYCYRGVTIIINEEKTSSNKNVITYTVNTYADWNMGNLNTILSLGGKSKNSEKYVNGTWKISGEAKVIKR